jgi:hypothetical protein
VWDLTNPDGGVFLVRGGIRGLNMPKVRHYRDKSPAVHGASYRGTTYDEREAFWPIMLYSDSTSRDFVELDSAFWRSLHPEHEGTWTITVPGVSTRSIRLRLEDDGDPSPEMDPTFLGWAQYGIRLIADQPFWEATALHREWQADVPADFFGGTTPGDPIIVISSSRSAATAEVTNPGDVEAWPIWTFTDMGAAGAHANVDGHSIFFEFAIASGDRLVVDTRPTEQTAFLYHPDGSYDDVFTSLTSYDPAPILSGNAAVLDLELLDNVGQIDLDLMPLYHRAW